jgi:hypothetical protein
MPATLGPRPRLPTRSPPPTAADVSPVVAPPPDSGPTAGLHYSPGGTLAARPRRPASRHLCRAGLPPLTLLLLGPQEPQTLTFVGVSPVLGKKVGGGEDGGEKKSCE